MFTKFKRERVTLFLDPNVQAQRVSLVNKERVDVILSPSLYWVKKIKLPLNSVREVKKLLPSIFEDSIPEAHYSYAAYKSGEEYFVFAYEDKKIFDLLAQRGVGYADIASVHFAQSEFEEIEQPFCINEKQCMQIKDELLVLTPSAWIKQSRPLELEGLKLSKHTIRLQQFGHIVDKSTLYKIGLALSLLVVIFIVEIFIASTKKAEIVDAKEEIFAKYKLQSTMFQNRSTLERYAKIHETQQTLRELMGHFLSLRLSATQRLTLLEYKNATLYVTLSGVTKDSSAAITKELEKKGIKYTASFSGENIKLEIKI